MQWPGPSALKLVGSMSVSAGLPIMQATSARERGTRVDPPTRTTRLPHWPAFTRMTSTLRANIEVRGCRLRSSHRTRRGKRNGTMAPARDREPARSLVAIGECSSSGGQAPRGLDGRLVDCIARARPFALASRRSRPAAVEIVRRPSAVSPRAPATVTRPCYRSSREKIEGALPGVDGSRDPRSPFTRSRPGRPPSIVDQVSFFFISSLFFFLVFFFFLLCSPFTFSCFFSFFSFSFFFFLFLAFVCFFFFYLFLFFFFFFFFFLLFLEPAIRGRRPARLARGGAGRHSRNRPGR